MRYWCMAVLVLAIAGVALLTPATALAQSTPSPAPSPSVSVAATSIPLTVKKNGIFDTRSTTGNAIGSVLVTWSGSDQASIAVAGYYSDGSLATISYRSGPTASPFPSPSPTLPPVPVSSASPEPIGVSAEWSSKDTTGGSLVLTDQAHPGPPIIVPFEVTELVPVGVLARVLLWSGVIAGILVFLVFLTLANKKPKRVLPVGPTWTFSQSWATNLTAVVPILGTVLAASGFFSSVLPGLSIGMFIGFNLFYGALVLIAPVVFQMCSWGGQSTYPGLLAAAGIILWALVGEFWTATVLLWRGGMPLSYGWFLVVGIGVLFVYTRASTAQVVSPPPPPPPSTAAPTPPSPAAYLI